MSYYADVIVTPNDLKNKTILQTNVMIRRVSEVLLTGTVLSEQCKPIQGAVIEITEIYHKNQRVKKGYVVTNQEGKFAVVVIKNKYINYQLDIYEPMIIC
ncbi:MAG: hypothetical protein ACERKZ_05360 [Lachnotalea sp.]